MGDCSHKQCERKPAMQRTISSALAEGKSDEQVLSLVSATYGSDVLITPTYSGFNTMLWIVPVAGALIAVAATVLVQKRMKARQK